MISMYLVMRMSYCNMIAKSKFEDFAYMFSVSGMEFISFILFYLLAIVNKKDTAPTYAVYDW